MCGATYKASYSAQRTCGRICGLALKRKISGWLPPAPKPPKPPQTQTCLECGGPLSKRRRKHCSAECSRARYRSDPEFRDRVISRAQNRNARKLGAAQIATPAALVTYLMERDHGRCGICHKPIRARNGPRRPSIDHIVPLSRGGTHELANLQASHYVCNLSKNARGGGEQLLLVG